MTTQALATPVDSAKRIPGPDLARGYMLLLIVLANTPFYLFGRQRMDTGAHPVDGSLLDQVIQGILITAVDLRVYPMFAFLFGYGLMMIMRRQIARGLSDRQVSVLLRRRNLWMIVFGAVHALLLWAGDVIGAYGLTGLIICALFGRRRDRTLLIWAGIGTGLLFLLGALSLLEIFATLTADYAPADADPGIVGLAYATITTESYLASMIGRMTVWPLQITVVQGVAGIVVPVSILLGLWAGRREILEKPQQHRRLLRTVAISGLGIGGPVGLFHALAATGVISGLESAMGPFTAIQLASGLACGLSYVAIFGLIGGALADRRLGPVSTAVVGVGKRSMTFYLAQSLLCAPVLAAWGLGLGGSLGSASMAGYAVAVWVLTVVVAGILERRGLPGPAEQLLRRLTYRPVKN